MPQIARFIEEHEAAIIAVVWILITWWAIFA